MSQTQKRFNMKLINEREFRDYTIVGNGWTMTVSSLSEAKRIWSKMTAAGCELRGNRHNGTPAILDSI